MVQELKKFLKTRQKINLALVGINILIFVLMEITRMQDWFMGNGASYTPFILEGQYYRLITSMFLHFGIEHLGNNMLVLFFLGDCLERNLGRWKYAVVYMAGGVGANLLSLFVELKQGQEVVSAGASGAVFAVIGALIYVVLVNKGRIENFTVRQLILMAALSLYHGVTSVGIDNAAHFGGLICGLILGILLYRKPKMRY